MPLAGRRRESVMAGLSRAAPHLRREVARQVRLRTVPSLVFRIDTAFDASSQMHRLLAGLVDADGSAAGDGA